MTLDVIEKVLLVEFITSLLIRHTEGIINFSSPLACKQSDFSIGPNAIKRAQSLWRPVAGDWDL